jgi:hypothetical protein
MGTRPSTSFASTSREFARSPGSCATSSGAEAYERDNASVRELGQRLAPVRDSTVRVSALERLRSTYEKEFPAEGTYPIQKRLASRHRAALGRLRRGTILSAIGRELEGSRQASPDLAAPSGGLRLS